MITTIVKKEVKTFWKGDAAWDLEKKYSKSTYLFGIRIRKQSEDMKCEPVEPSISRNIGFTK